MATTKKLHYSPSEDQQTASWETGTVVDDEGLAASFEEVADPDYEVSADPDYDLGADPDYDDFAQPAYDESAPVDYDLGADPDYSDEPAAPAAEAVPAAPPAPLFPAAGFTYALGRRVLPVTQQQPHAVVWQGYLKERHPVTGLVQRVPVYRLSDGFWDCYREDELQVA